MRQHARWIALLAATAAPVYAADGDRAGRAGPASLPSASGEAVYTSVEAAIADLSGKEPAKQIAAAHWLAGQGQDAALKALPTAIKLLAEGDVATEQASHAGKVTPRTAVAAMIMVADDKALDPLVAAFDSDNSTLKANLLPFISRRQGDAALQTLLKAAKDPSVKVRSAAANYLVRFPGSDAATALFDLLDDESAMIRAHAANSLPHVTTAPNDDRNKPAKQLISNQLRLKIAERLSVLLDNDTDDRVQISAARTLGDMKPNDLSALVRAAEKPHLRMYAAQGLAGTGDMRASMALLKILQDPIPADWKRQDRQYAEYARAAAARGLGLSKDLRAVDALMKVVANRLEEIPVREAAAEALGQIGDRRATAPLIAALAPPPDPVGEPAAVVANLRKFPPHDRMQVAIVKSLGELKDPAAVQPLIDVLTTGTRRGIHAAAETLGELGDPAAVDPLVKLLLSSEGDSYAVDAAAKGLLKIRSRKVVQRLIEGNQAATTHGYATHIARRTVDKITGSGLAFAGPDVVAGWWKEHQAEWTETDK